MRKSKLTVAEKSNLKLFKSLLEMPEKDLIIKTNRKVSDSKAEIFGFVLATRYPTDEVMEAACEKYLL